MNEKELDRIKSDMEIIKEAAGLDLPFGWDSVLVNALLMPLMGIYYIIYYYVFLDRSSLFKSVGLSLVPVVIILTIMGWLRIRYRKSTGRSAAKRNEYGFTFYSNVIIGIAMGGYYWWYRTRGLDFVNAAPGIILILGVTGILLAFFMKGRLFYLGSSIPMILWGISMMIWNSTDMVVLSTCLTAIVSGITMACIQVIQIKANERINAAD